MGLLSFLTGASTNKKSTFSIGQISPEFHLQNENDEPVHIKFSDEYTFIYFYPKADTPGCTAQACSLRDAFEQLQSEDVKVFGVSTDKPKALSKFKNKYKLPFTLLSDQDKKMANAYEVPVKLGFASRQAFLFKGNKLIWLDRSASTKKQAEDVLKVLSKQ